jgi:hypothetical protein
MENETLPEGYFEALDINANGLVKIGEYTYQSTLTGNKYFYNGKELSLIEETRDEQIKSEWDKIKQKNNYTEGKITNNEPKSERDLFRVLVGEDGLVKQIVTTKE